MKPADACVSWRGNKKRCRDLSFPFPNTSVSHQYLYAQRNSQIQPKPQHNQNTQPIEYRGLAPSLAQLDGILPSPILYFFFGGRHRAHRLGCAVSPTRPFSPNFILFLTFSHKFSLFALDEFISSPSLPYAADGDIWYDLRAPSF